MAAPGPDGADAIGPLGDAASVDHAGDDVASIAGDAAADAPARDGEATTDADTTPSTDAASSHGSDAADTGASDDAGPSFPCNLDCPAGPCPMHAGPAPVVIATGPRGERVASLAVGADAAFFGTISSDIFARGRLSKVTLSTGQSTVLDPGVQVSWIGLAPSTVFYIADAVQAHAEDLWSMPLGGGAPRDHAQSDDGFTGVFIQSDNAILYEPSYGSVGIIWHSSWSPSGDASGLGQVVQTMGPPRGFAADATTIYYATGAGPSTIQLAPYDRSILPEDIKLLLTSDDPVGQLVVDGADLFFVHESAAGRCQGSVAVMPKAGGTPRLVSLGRSGSDVSSIAVDGGFVYWTTFDDGGRVLRAARSGGTPEILSVNQRSASNLVVDAHRVYWIVEDPNGDQIRALGK